MPKHVGFGLTLHNIWRTKELVQMLNRHGHSISYMFGNWFGLE